MSIVVDHLSFGYGQGRGMRRLAGRRAGAAGPLVLDDLSLEIPDGTLVGVLGHNGAGKSTLFKCILGLLDGYSGTILINGHDARRLSVAQRAREVAYIPQSHSSVYDYAVIDVVTMSTSAGLGILGQPGREHVERAWRALERVGIESLARRPYTQISGGEQQLTLIARAIAQDARTIIMDEPTSALDFGNTVRVLGCVRRLASEGLSIVQSTHQPDHAFLYADKTLVIHDGKAFAYGAPRDVITAGLVSEVYGIDVEVDSLHDDAVRVCVPIDSLRAQEARGGGRRDHP